METFAEAWVVASAKGTFTYPPINGFQVSFSVITAPVYRVSENPSDTIFFRYYHTAYRVAISDRRETIPEYHTIADII